jgi:outer membrane protein assembly factor BamB
LSKRTITILLVTLGIMAGVMGLSLALSGLLGGRPTSLQFESIWQAPSQGVEAMKLVAASGSSKSELFVQDAAGAAVLDAATGKRLFERPMSAGSGSTLGDVDGDGRLELLLFERAGTAVLVESWRLADRRKLWGTLLQISGDFERAIAVDLDATRRASAVLRTSAGQLLAIGPDGGKRWVQQGSTGELVSLDTVSVRGEKLTLCALKNEASVLDASGAVRWRRISGAGLRRARSLEPVTGESVVVLGEENGVVTALAGADGSELWSKNVGQPPTELRLAELDGDPASLELVVGGKKGGLWAFSRTGSDLFSSTTGAGKINEIASFLPDSGASESLLVGGSEGNLVLVTAGGKRAGSQHYSAAIERMVAGQLAGRAHVFVAAGSLLTASSIVAYEAPAFYTLLAAGAFGCVVVALVAFLIGRSRPAEPVRVAAEQMTVEAQKARKIMLRESLRELRQLSSQLSPTDLVKRLRELREQLADADRRLLELGASLQPEIFRCGQCGGPLEIGAEQCDYCGATVVA